ncbi:unnamed protein product, partial [Notodromas monacha]
QLKRNLFVITGDISAKNYVASQDAWTIQANSIYPGFDTKRSFQQNLAMLYLEPTVEFSQYFDFIPLPADIQFTDASYSKENIVGFGFGSITSTSTEVETKNPFKIYADQVNVMLRQLTMPVVDISVCQKIYNYTATDVELSSQLCYGGEPNKGVCLRDEGGPVTWIRPSDGTRIIIAVNTNKYGCSKGLANIGTKIAGNHLRWIQAIINTTVTIPKRNNHRGFFEWLPEFIGSPIRNNPSENQQTTNGT